MWKPTLTLALALTTLAGCSHDGPTAPSRACRKWPLRYTTGGMAFNCKASVPTPSCSAFPTSLDITWTYRSQSDFVHEADVPNRILAQSQTTQGCGTFVTTGCNTSFVKFDHDAQGRVVRRERSSRHSFGGGGGISIVADVVTYTAWDGNGRPTQGQFERDGQTVPLTITYDDVRRIAQASNGDLVEQDAWGNVIREVVVQNGSSIETLYEIEAFQDVCEEGV